MAISQTARVIIGQVNKQFGKVRKAKSAEQTISVFNHLSKDEKAITQASKKVMLAQMEAVPKAIQGMGDVIFPAEQFAAKRTKLIEFAQKTGDRKLLRQIQGAKTPDDLYKVCTDYNIGLVKDLESRAASLISGSRGKVTLEMEQLAYGLKNGRAEKMFGLYEAIGRKSTNPDVLKIEQALRQEYGMKNVNLQDDLARGEEILKVVKGLKAKGHPIPNNVLVSDLHPTLGELVRANGESTMVLQSSEYYRHFQAAANNPQIKEDLLKLVTKDDLLNYSIPLGKAMRRGVTMHSTTNPLHAVTHECMHGIHPNVVSYHTSKLPARFKPTVENISLYTNINKNKAEIITELETKLFLTGSLKPDEMELYRHIKGIKA